MRELAELDKKTELAVLIDAIDVARSSSRARSTPSVVFDLVRLLTGRSAGRAGRRAGRTGKAGDQRPAAGLAADRLRLADRTSTGRADKAWELADRSVGVAGATSSTRCRWSPMPACGPACIRKIEPLLDGLPTALADGKRARRHRRAITCGSSCRGRGTLTLAEVEVMSDGRNVARAGKATQKNTANGGDASRAIDGNKSGDYGDGGQTHTEENTANPWWEVDLGGELPIESIVVYNRTDGDLGKRLDGFTLKVLDGDRKRGLSQDGIEAPRASVHDSTSARRIRPARVRQRGDDGADARSRPGGQDVRRAGARSSATIATGPRRSARCSAFRAPTGRRTRPGRCWTRVLGYIAQDARRRAHHARRARRAGVRRRAGGAAAGRPRPSRPARELGELGVRVIRVGTLFERMSYDKDVIAVAGRQAGRVPLREHRPDAAQLRDRPARARWKRSACWPRRPPSSPAPRSGNYVPRSDKVLLASTLLQPRESQKLELRRPDRSRASIPMSAPIPATGGGCTARCTSSRISTPTWPTPRATWRPIRWRSRTRCSKDRRPRTEWKFDDLAAAVGELKGGRSFGNGKQMFQVASCVACHKLDGVGNEFGPDLTKLDAKLHAARHPQGAARSVGQDQREVSDVHLRARQRQGRHRPGPGRDARADQA